MEQSERIDGAFVLLFAYVALVFTLATWRADAKPFCAAEKVVTTRTVQHTTCIRWEKR